MAIKTKPFDVSAHLQTDEDIREFLNIMLEENGTEGFERALAYVATAKGMTDIVRLDTRPLSLETIDKAVHSLGLRLSVQMAA
jgi:DNA-binding phage protein